MKPYKIIISVIVCCALISALAAVSAIVGSFAAGQKGPVIDVSPLPEKEAGQISDATGTGSDFETALPVKTPEATPTETPEPTPEPTSESTPAPTSTTGRVIDPDKPIVALSFDDGPGHDSTIRILKLIKKYNISATFFVVGDMVKYHRDVIAMEAEYGCEIANHTMTHELNFKRSDQADVDREIQELSDIIESITGRSTYLVRPPGGSYNQTALDNAKFPYILWSVDTRDWESRDKDKIFEVVKRDTFDGAIILMHDIHKTTADACELVIPWHIEQGYQVVSVSELFQARGIELKPGNIYRMAKPDTSN